MAKRRTTTRYRVENGRGKEVWVGITVDPERREQEHQRRFGSGSTLIPEGPKVTPETARKWEEEQGEKGRKTRRSR